jgi:uncharacterized protein (TIGR02001 family)
VKSLALGLIVASIASSAWAIDLRGRTDFSAEASIVSDYRYRGVSLTDNEAAFQGSVTAEHESGFYGSLWGSVPLRGTGETEIDISVGYTFGVGPGTADLSVVGYVYPNLDNSDYVNLIAAYEIPVGEWTARAAVEYAPPQRGLSQYSSYASLGVERSIAKTGVTLFGTIGYEQGAFTLDGEKVDYSLGLRYPVGPLMLSIAYVDTDEKPPAGAEDVFGEGVVVGVSAEF